MGLLPIAVGDTVLYGEEEDPPFAKFPTLDEDVGDMVDVNETLEVGVF